jgi:dienelactone hydrolase
MKGIALVFTAIALIVANTRVGAEVNRTPVGDEAFSLIADYFGYDRSLPLRAEVISTQTHDGRELPYLTDKVHFRSIRDEIVVGYFAYQRDSTATHYPTIILLHGNNRYRGSQDDWTTSWLDVLAREGYCVLAIDQYGYGDRFITGKAPNFVGNMGPYEKRDVTIEWVVDARRAIDYLHTRSEVDTNRVALMGCSLGGLVSCLTAGLESRLKSVVLVSTGSWPKDGATDDHVLRLGHMLNFAPRIKASVLMESATQDGVENGKELFQLLPEPKKIMWHESEHVILMDEYKADVIQWLSQNLK